MGQNGKKAEVVPMPIFLVVILKANKHISFVERFIYDKTDITKQIPIFFSKKSRHDTH